MLTWLTYAEFHTFSLTSLSKLLKLDAWRLQRGAFGFAYVRAWAECRQFGPDLSLYKIVKNLVNSWRARLVHWRWWRLRHRTLTEPTTNEVSGYATSHTTRCRNKCLNSKIWPDLSLSLFLSLQYWLACPRVFHFFIYIYGENYTLTCQLNQNHGNSLSRDAVKVDFSLALCCLLLHSSSSFYRLYLSNKIDITFSNFRIVRVISEIWTGRVDSVKF